MGAPRCNQPAHWQPQVSKHYRFLRYRFGHKARLAPFLPTEHPDRSPRLRQRRGTPGGHGNRQPGVMRILQSVPLAAAVVTGETAANKGITDAMTLATSIPG